MNNKISISKNFIMNALLAMSSFIFPLITFPYVSRVLLPAGTGRVSFALSLVSYFTMFAQLGIPTYGIRACAKVRDNKDELSRTAQELLIISLIMSCVAYIVLGLSLFFIPKLHDDRLLYIIVSITIILSSIGMEWLYKALEQYTYITVRSIVFKLIALIAMFLLVHKKEDYIIYGAISIFASSASSILNLMNSRRYITLKPIWGYNLLKHYKAVLIFFAMACATTIYTHLDTVMLFFMKTDVDVGYYDAAVKVKRVLLSIVTSLGAVILPRASYYIEQGRKSEFLRISEKALNFVLLLSVPLMAYFMVFAKQCILTLSGSAYIGAVPAMIIIVPTIVLIGVTNIIGIQMLVPLGKEKYVLLSEVAGAVTDLFLNFLLIPKFAAAGAAIGTLVAEIVVLGVQFYVSKDMINPMLKTIDYKGIFIATILGVISVIWVPTVIRRNLLQLVVSSILFFSVYLLFFISKRNPIVMEGINRFGGLFKRR